MSQHERHEDDQDPGPVKESDAERVTDDETGEMDGEQDRDSEDERSAT